MVWLITNPFVKTDLLIVFSLAFVKTLFVNSQLMNTAALKNATDMENSECMYCQFELNRLCHLPNYIMQNIKFEHLENPYMKEANKHI